jgi:hypothetical protein
MPGSFFAPSEKSTSLKSGKGWSGVSRFEDDTYRVGLRQAANQLPWQLIGGIDHPFLSTNGPI